MSLTIWKLAAARDTKCCPQGQAWGWPCAQHPWSTLPTQYPHTGIWTSQKVVCLSEHRPCTCCFLFWTRVKTLTGTQINISQIQYNSIQINNHQNFWPVAVTSQHTQLPPPESRAKCYLQKASSVCLILRQHPSATKHKNFLLKENYLLTLLLLMLI